MIHWKNTDSLASYKELFDLKPIELAKEMGLEFQANVEPWHYDEEKRKEHEKEVALQEKEDAKQRKLARAKKMRYRIEKRRKEMDYDKK